MISAQDYADDAMRAGHLPRDAIRLALQRAAQRGTQLTHAEDLEALSDYVTATADSGGPRAPHGYMNDARHYANLAMHAGISVGDAIRRALEQAEQVGTPLTHSDDLDALRDYVRTTTASGGPRVLAGYMSFACDEARDAVDAGASLEVAVQQGLRSAEAHFGHPMTNPADFEVLRRAITR